jgi:hypothetical protein
MMMVIHLDRLVPYQVAARDEHTVTCYLLTRQIVCGLRILYLDLLDLHQAEVAVTYNTSNYIT